METRNTVRATEFAILRQFVPVSVRFGALWVAGLSPRHAIAFAIGETAVEVVRRRAVRSHAARRADGRQTAGDPGRQAPADRGLH